MPTEFRTPRTVLFPVDLSETSGSAAALVSGIAGRFHSRVVVLFALPPIEHPFELFSGGMLETRSRTEVARAHLDDFVRRLRLDFEYQCLVQEGQPAEVITRAAEEIDADLVCMATRGRGPFRSFLLGSTAAKVLNDSGVPVLTGAHLEHTSNDRELELRTVVCAVDLDERSHGALQAAFLLSSHFHSRLVIVHAVENESTGQHEQLRQMLACAAPGPGVKPDLVVADAKPAELVNAAAIEHRADLVVIGRSAPGPMGRIRTQSYAIVRSSPCPVLSL